MALTCTQSHLVLNLTIFLDLNNLNNKKRETKKIKTIYLFGCREK